jgi:hypothetical protein
VARLAGVLDAVGVDERVVRVALRGGVVERVAEDADGRDVLVGREVLAADDEHLVPAQRGAQLVRGGLVDGQAEIDTADLGADAGSDRGGGERNGGGHVVSPIKAEDHRRTR